MRVRPRPAQPSGPRILLGGTSEGAARRAARIADGFIPSEPACWQFYRDECLKLGKPDPGPGMTGHGDVVILAENPDAAEQRRSKGNSGAEDQQDHRASIRLTDDQIGTAGIEVAAVKDGTLARRIVVPGTIVPHADRIARVSVKLSATVTELRKKLGDTVAKGEVIAVLESREVANAKSEYLAARLNNDLQKNLHERDKILWDRHVIAEQIVLRSRVLRRRQG